MWKSKKYKYRLSGFIGIPATNKIFESNCKAIDEKRIVDYSASCYRTALINSLSKTGSLYLTFKLEVIHFEDPIFRQKTLCTTHAKLERMDQYLNLLNDSTFSDFTFFVKGTNFKVHKAVLASQSETMRAMFTINLKEFVQGECIVDHIEPDIFQHMLRFIYSGNIAVNEFENISIDLYKAAHYYRIETLMEMCKENIHFRLNVCNALEIYELTTFYDMEDVKADAWRVVKL